MSHFFETKRIIWHYEIHGSGSKLLLAFHGFNRSASDFHSFARHLDGIYTIVSIDLLFHGKSRLKSQIRESLPTLHDTDLLELQHHFLNSFGVQKCTLMGYSFGGRVAMKITELNGKSVDMLCLIASDALKWNPGYAFAARTMLGRSLFLLMARYPSSIFSLMNFMGKVGLFHPKAVDFYKNQITNEQVRYRVYNVWVAHRKLVPDIRKVARQVVAHNITLRLFFGSYDKIIPSEMGSKLSRLSQPFASVHILEAGHRVFEKSQEISTILLNTHVN